MEFRKFIIWLKASQSKLLEAFSLIKSEKLWLILAFKKYKATAYTRLNLPGTLYASTPSSQNRVQLRRATSLTGLS